MDKLATAKNVFRTANRKFQTAFHSGNRAAMAHHHNICNRANVLIKIYLAAR